MENGMSILRMCWWRTRARFSAGFWRERLAEIRLRWRLAMHGEVMILNAIDAIETADVQISNHAWGGPPNLQMAKMYHEMALAQLKRVIDYEDEPEPTFPDDAMELADGVLGVSPAIQDIHATFVCIGGKYEGDGILQIVPRDHAHQEHA